MLALDERGCVVLDGEPLVWPRGWSVYEDGDGFVVHDETGRTVARDGERVTATIDYRAPRTDHRCTDGVEHAMFLKPGMT